MAHVKILDTTWKGSYSGLLHMEVQTFEVHVKVQTFKETSNWMLSGVDTVDHEEKPMQIPHSLCRCISYDRGAHFVNVYRKRPLSSGRYSQLSVRYPGKEL